MLVFLLSLVWGWRKGMFQLSGFHSTLLAAPSANSAARKQWQEGRTFDAKVVVALSTV